MTASLLTTWSFIALVMVMVLVAGWTFARHSGLKGNRRIVLGAFGLLAYVILPAILASRNLIDQYAPVPQPMLLIAGVSAITFYVAFSPLGARLAQSISLAALVGFQVFRIPVELLLHRLWQEGMIPRVMTYEGLNFDIVTGITAALLGYFLLRGRASITITKAWNILGLLLLATIVGIAVLASPVPIHVAFEGPINTLPSRFPFVWLPTVLVQLALLGHLLVFRRLSAERGPQGASGAP